MLLGGGSGGPSPGLSLKVTVDDAIPQFILRTPDNAASDNAASRPYFSSNSITLDYNEVVSIELVTRAVRTYCEWDLRIDYTFGGHAGYLYVNRKGVLRRNHDEQPLSNTGIVDVHRYGVLYTRAGPLATSLFQPASVQEVCAELEGLEPRGPEGFRC
jgi:hypothetical protein